MANPASHSRKDSSKTTPVVSVIMGSKSDWETMKAASDILTEFGVARRQAMHLRWKKFEDQELAEIDEKDLERTMSRCN